MFQVDLQVSKVGIISWFSEFQSEITTPKSTLKLAKLNIWILLTYIFMIFIKKTVVVYLIYVFGALVPTRFRSSPLVWARSRSSVLVLRSSAHVLDVSAFLDTFPRIYECIELLYWSNNKPIAEQR